MRYLFFLNNRSPSPRCFIEFLNVMDILLLYGSTRRKLSSNPVPSVGMDAYAGSLGFILKRNAPKTKKIACENIMIAKAFPEIFLCSFVRFNRFNVLNKNAWFVPELKLTPIPLIIFPMRKGQNPCENEMMSISMM